MSSTKASSQHATSHATSHTTSTASSPKSTSAPTADPVVQPTTQSQAHYVRGSLAAGSIAHRLAIGQRHLVLDYWTTQDVGTWTSSQSVPIHVSAHLEDSGSAKAVLVTRFFATFATNSSPNVTTLREDDGNFVITPPFSYDTALIVPAVTRATRTARLSVEIDMLIETAPKSKMYSRETVLDSIAFTYAKQTSAVSS